MRLDTKDIFYLGHILEAISRIEQLTDAFLYDQFIIDWKTQDAVVRNLEVIGEAVNNISDELKVQYPDIAWRDARNMRNFLIHVYFSIDYQVVWNTVKIDLPHFKQQVIDCLQKLES